MNVVFKESLISGVIGGVISAGVAYLLACHVLPVPGNVFDSAVASAATGLFSGLFSGFVGVYVALKQLGKPAPQLP